MSGAQMAWSLGSQLIESGGDGAAAGGTRVPRCELGASQGGMQGSDKMSERCMKVKADAHTPSRPSHEASVIKKGQVSTLIELCVLR